MPDRLQYACNEVNMNTAVANSPSTQAAIDQAKQRTQMCKHRFETTFGFIPDDKLDYAPSPTTKTPLQIAAHTAMSNFVFASIIRREPPTKPFAEIQAEMAQKEAALTTRAQVLETLARSVQAVNDALDAITDETVGIDVPTPVFTAPMSFWMDLPSRHMDNHAAQIDYIQTVWGDMDWHMQ